MTKDAYFDNEGRSKPMVVQSEAQLSRAQGLFGALDSYSRRRAADRITSELDAAARAYEAATRMNHAKEAYNRAVSRLTNNMEKIALEEQMKVESEFCEQELRLAELQLKKQLFEDEAAKRRKRAKSELLEEELRYNRAYEALHGAQPEAQKQQTPEEQREELVAERDELVDKIKNLAAEYLERTQTGAVDEATEQAFNRKNNALVEDLERVEAELAKL